MSTLRPILLLAFVLGQVHAERYAVLVGVSKDNPSVPADSPVLLQGPGNDVMAMRAELSKNWRFKSENIAILLDAKAALSENSTGGPFHAAFLKATNSVLVAAMR